MKIVFATATAMIDGHLIREGSHWPANDPLVLANPGHFSDDSRVGLQATVPIDDDIVESVTAGPGEKRAQVRRG